MNSKQLISFLTFCFVFFQSTLSSQPEVYHEVYGESAAKRFCQQDQYHGVAYDGRFYKFFTHKVSRQKSILKYTWEEYRLEYNRKSDSFEYVASIKYHQNGKICLLL